MEKGRYITPDQIGYEVMYDQTPDGKYVLENQYNSPYKLVDKRIVSGNTDNLKLGMEGLMNNETPEEKAKRLGVRLIPKVEPPQNDPNPIVAVCGECGECIRKIMQYTCPKNNCPTFPKATF